MYQNLKNKLIYKYSIQYALTSIFGINTNSAIKVCAIAGIPFELKVSKLSESNIENILKILNNNFIMELNLKKEQYDLFEKIKEVKNLKALRFSKRLPVRGQRTHTNAKTCKRVNFINAFDSEDE